MKFKVRELAEEQGFSIRSLAKNAHLAYDTVHAIWHNRRGWASQKTLEALAQVLRTTPRGLMEDEEG